jgi:nicotinamide-nucleotide amidase
VSSLTELAAAAEALIADCTRLGLRIATAESCTGGLIVTALTEVAGASVVVDRGFVTYSNAAKTEMLGVSAEAIARGGAVSEAVARAMAEGALVHSLADLTVAVTGIAGPGGGTKEKPVGLVHMAAHRRGAGTLHQAHIFPDNGRAGIRIAAAAAALVLLRSLL